MPTPVVAYVMESASELSGTHAMGITLRTALLAPNTHAVNILVTLEKAINILVTLEKAINNLPALPDAHESNEIAMFSESM